MNYKYIKELKARNSKSEFEEVLIALFDKRITNEQFKTLINSIECVFRRL